MLLWILPLVICTCKGANTEVSSSDLIPCNEGWFHFNKKCYKILGERKGLNWAEASVACSVVKGHLATIDSPELQEFLTKFLLLNAQTDAWIGLHFQEYETVFKWDDGLETNYTHWDENQPSGWIFDPWALESNKEDCVEMRYENFGTELGTWNDEPCIREQPYLCQVNESKETLSRDPRFCSIEEGDGWKYLNSCYHIITEKKSWKDAENYCEENFLGHLVAIFDEKPESFLKTVLPNYTEGFWIGVKMRDQVLQLWSSDLHVNYSNWEENQKDFVPETCGMMAKKGPWRIVPCFRKLPFICETSRNYVNFQRVSRKRRPTNYYVPCEDGWFYYNEKCYKIGKTTEKLTWTRARDRCASLHSYLVTIKNKEENRFLFGILMLESTDDAWIGLHDRVNESNYLWVDGSTAEYQNWRINEPSGLKAQDEDCVHILNEYIQGSFGKWNDSNCDTKRGYICEKNSDPQKRSPNPQYCCSENGCGSRYNENCYHIVDVENTWEEAEKHCVDNYKGHLLTVLDTSVDWFLHYQLQISEYWIGIKMQDRYQQKWSSGWFVGYNGFSDEQRNFGEDTCVARKKQKQWTIVPCFYRYPFICEKSSKTAPVLKPPPKDSYCPKVPRGWRDLDGESCYFVELFNVATWYEANFECMRKGGHLASLHSKEESELLNPFIKYAPPPLVAYIGLFRPAGITKTFAWMDGSPVDFINWNPGKPDYEHEKCIEARSSDMKWSDTNCTEKRSYICSTRKIIPNTRTEKTEGEVTPGIQCAFSFNAFFTAFFAGMISLLILLGVVIYCCRLYKKKMTNSSKKAALPPLNSLSYNSANIRRQEQDPYYVEMT